MPLRANSKDRPMAVSLLAGPIQRVIPSAVLWGLLLFLQRQPLHLRQQQRPLRQLLLALRQRVILLVHLRQLVPHQALLRL
jgi:hypothetical protein